MTSAKGRRSCTFCGAGRRGESGWWFEGDAFGGGILMAEDPKEAGTPYLLDSEFICSRISETFIHNVINDSKLRDRSILTSP